jgi:hypothetical protein
VLLWRKWRDTSISSNWLLLISLDIAVWRCEFCL